MLDAIYRYRNYIISNAISELKYRYAGSSLGFFWNIVNPVLQIIVYTFVFSNIMQSKMEALKNTSGFSLYLCAGMFGWLAFNECVARGANTFVEVSSFLKKLSVPEYVFVAQKSLASLLNCLLNYVIIFIYSIIVSGAITIYWLYVPIVLILLLMFGHGLAMLFATINVFFRDTVQIINVLLMIMMWITPIVYVPEILPEVYQRILNFNILYPFIHSLQQIIVFGNTPDFMDFIKMIIIAVCSVALGCVITKKNISEIRDLV